jgi:hypothetical protein
MKINGCYYFLASGTFALRYIRASMQAGNRIWLETAVIFRHKLKGAAEMLMEEQVHQNNYSEWSLKAVPIAGLNEMEMHGLVPHW